MSKVGFNLLEYARMNNLKLQASAKLKDGSSLKFFSNKGRVDCFHLSKENEILDAKGASGSRPNLFGTVSGILEKVKDQIVSVSTYVK